MTMRIAIVHAHKSLRPNYVVQDLLSSGGWPAGSNGATGVILTDQVDNADVAMLASSWQLTCAQGHEADAREAIERTRERGRNTVVMSDHDATRPLDLGPSGGIVYRTSMLATVDYGAEFAKPGFANSIDPESALFRTWSSIPVVSFVGQTHNAALTSALRRGRTEFGEASTRPATSSGAPTPTGHHSLGSPMNVGLVIRRRAVNALRSSTSVHAEIIERDRFFADFAPAEQAPLIAAFHVTMADSDYGLCVRGAGNYSYRLYETMAAGRIPIIADTSMVMPFADRIDWRRLGIWIGMDELDTIGERVAEFHHDLGPDGFDSLQREIRSVHRKYLSREGFARTLFLEDLPRLLREGAAR